MSAEFDSMSTTFAMEAGKAARLPVPHGIGRKRVAEAFASAFEMIGGIPRLALWAHQNPTEFYRLYSRLIPPAVQEHTGEIRIIHSIKRTSLDGVQSDDSVVLSIAKSDEEK